MKRFLATTSLWTVIASLVLNGFVSDAPIVAADECRRGSLRGNLLSHGSEATLAINGNSHHCRVPSGSGEDTQGAFGPVYLFEVLCNSNSNQGPGTLCSVAPCVQAGKSFALRNIRYQDGRTDPAGFQCLNPERAEVNPGITFAQVFSAIRSVRLPGG
jgi:hypothetical protein